MKNAGSFLPTFEYMEQDASRATVLDFSFEAFWQRYPKKVAKVTARRAWEKARPTPALIAKIHATLDWQIPLWTDPTFTPNPATWLNAGRWDDEPVKPRGRVNGSAVPAAASWREECATLGHSPSCGTPMHHALRKRLFDEGCRHDGVCQSFDEHRRRSEGAGGHGTD